MNGTQFDSRVIATWLDEINVNIIDELAVIISSRIESSLWNHVALISSLNNRDQSYGKMDNSFLALLSLSLSISVCPFSYSFVFIFDVLQMQQTPGKWIHHWPNVSGC